MTRAERLGRAGIQCHSYGQLRDPTLDSNVPGPRPTLVFARFPCPKFLGNGIADRRYACFDDVPVSHNFGTRNSGPPKRLYLRGFRVPTFWDTDFRTTETPVFKRFPCPKILGHGFSDTRNASIYEISVSQNLGKRIFGPPKR